MGDSRDFKANSEHWTVIIDYFEMYPQLLKNKFETFAGDTLQSKKIWEQLVNQLNSLGYGRKTTEKWQLAIGRWKSKVKGKATNLKREMERTGGGPLQSPPLTDLEERLMSILGWKSVTGDMNKELGICKEIRKETQKILPTQTVSVNVVRTSADGDVNTEKGIEVSREMTRSTCSESSPPPLQFLKDRSSESLNDKLEIELPRVHAAQTSQNKENRNASLARKRNISKKVETFTKRKVLRSTEKSRKYVTLTHMHHENLEILKTIAKNGADIARSLDEIKNTFKEHLDYLKREENPGDE